MAGQLHSPSTLIDILCQVSVREETRAKTDFEAQHGRQYDGGSDDDWDALDKSYTAVDEAIRICRGVLELSA